MATPLYGFLSVISRVITDGLQSEHGELVICAFCLLQTDDIWLCRLQPRKQAILPPAQRVDVPRRDFHGVILSEARTSFW